MNETTLGEIIACKKGQEIMFKQFFKKSKSITYNATFSCDLGKELSNYNIVNTSIGPKREICILLIDHIPERIDGMFPPTKTDKGFTYKIIIVNHGSIQELFITDQQWNYHFVQPIEQDKYLLACARSHFYNNEHFDLNGRVFNDNGNLVREFLLGDGIQDIKVSPQNRIWTSYFDEGIYGNYGWDEPLGRTGLRSWDLDGTPLYRHPTTEMSDCYALNVVDDNEVWFYYYTEFELAVVKDNKVTYYPTGISGADGFIIYRNYILFRGGYDDKDDYTLFTFEADKLKKLKSVRVNNQEGIKIKADHVDCRGSLMLIQADSKLYTVDLKELVGQL